MSLNPLEQLDIVTIAAVVVIWLATFVILRRVLLLPLLAVMARRQHKLDAAAVVRGEARALVERAERDAAKIATEATEVAQRLDREVKDDLIRQREAKLADAGGRAQAISARGRDEVERIRAAEQAKLEEQLFACSRQALRKMIGEVDDTALRVIVGGVVAGGRARGKR